MAKPNSQTGHGSHGGTEDESSLAHGEASRGDAEGDGGSEADWDIPAAPDNSTLSRILGLVLIVVLAGVFSFVAYRKYDEARRNPTSGQTVADSSTGKTSPEDPNAEPGATSPAGGREGAGRGNSTNFTQHDGPQPAASLAQGRTASADAFGSLDDRSPSRFETGASSSSQHNHQTAGASALTQTHTAGNTNPPAAKEPDGNPFGDLGGSSERANQQAPPQGEPPQQAAGGTPATGWASKADATGGFSPNGALNRAVTTGGMPRGTGEPHAPSAATADAEMQNLFPSEGAAKHDQQGQNLAAHGTTLEPVGMTRAAQLQDQPTQIGGVKIQSRQIQPGQTQAARTPPTQSEPLDNELLDEARSPAHPAAGDRGVVHMQQDSRGPGAATSAAPNTGRAQALLAGKERTPLGEESAFGNSEPSAGTSSHAIPRPADQSPSTPSPPTLSPHQASSTTALQGRDAHAPSGTDDPFTTNRSSTGGRVADRSGASPATEGAFSQSGRVATGAGSVTAVATTSDAGDYYVVQPQDNFWTISRKKYGTSRYFQALAELNKARIPDAGRMRPGMKVSTPAAEILEERYAQFLPPGTKVQVTAAEDSSAKSAPTGFVVGPDGTPKYRTGENDTLSNIAAKHLGRASRWIQIYEMNRDKLTNPNQLKVGTELTLPGDASSVGLSNEDDDRR
jgi:nucleoid-associated protein YgaU